MNDEELIQSLTGAILVSEALQRPDARKAGRNGLADLCGLVVALRRRVEVLERRPVPKYRGVYRTGTEYDEGTLITHSGSLWHANRATSDKPDAGTGSWTLCVKRGQDGKDLR